VPQLRIQTLGPFRIWRSGQLAPAGIWPTHKSQALFKILVTERGRFVPAERLMNYLWPDLPPKRAQNNLWVTMSQVRRALQPDLPRRAPSDFVLTRREGYTFSQDSDHWLDVDEFTSQVQAAHQAGEGTARIQAFEAARQLYHGDYLEADPYEEWALAAREELRRSYLSLLADLAEAYARQGRYRRAISLCHESLALENADEPVYRHLMLYHFRAGELSAALKSYDECCRVLREELDVEPMPETTALFHQIVSRQVEVVDREIAYPSPVDSLALPRSLSRTPFVGRRREHGQLAHLLAQAAAGQGHVVLIAGEPGIGKSRLVQETLSLAAVQGLETLVAQCYQIEQTVPYLPVIEMAKHVVARVPPETLQRVPKVWLAEIAALVPEISEAVPGVPTTPADVDESRQARLFQALEHLLLNSVGDLGLVIIVDDIHWADPASLQFLHHLARNIGRRPILLVCTYRSEAPATYRDLAEFVRSMKRIPHVSQIDLVHLSDGDVKTLLESMGSPPPGAIELGHWLHRETDGNPFFLVSILQSMLEQGLLTMGDKVEWQADTQALRAAGIELTLPEALRESVRDRLSRVPQRMRRVLDLAAVIGQRFGFATLQAVLQEEQESLLTAIEGLVDRQLLQEEGDGLLHGFSHDKIREVVYYELSATRRTLYHRGVAQALEAQAGGDPGANASILAHHFERAGDLSTALRYWLHAGKHALATYAPQQAARHFERALALAAIPAERVDAYHGLGRAHFALDEHESAIADLNQGLRLVGDSDPRRGRMLYLLADVHFARYDTEASESYVRAALSAAESAGDPETVSQSLSLLGQAYSSRGELDAEFDLITRALDITRQSGNPWREGRTLADLGWLQAQTGAFTQAAESAEQALKLLETMEDQAGLAFAWNVLGRAQGGQGNYETAFAAFRRSGEIAEAIDHRFLIAQVPNMLGWLHFQLGDYQGALARDREGAEMASQWRKSPPEISALINVTLDILHLGDPAQALADLSNILTKIERDVSGFHAWRWRLRVLHGQALCHLALDEADQAVELADDGLALSRSTSCQKYVALNLEVRGRALASLNMPAEASAELASAIDLADKISYQPLRWKARSRLAALYTETGQQEGSLALLTEAQCIISSVAAGLTDDTLRAALLASEPDLLHV
jgi:DNA-binding SARP family transcriptional activator